MNRSRPRAPLVRPGAKKSGAAIWIGIAVAVALVVAGFIAAAIATSRAQSFDKTTLCNLEGPSAVTAILIDTTDGVNAVQRRAVLNRLTRINRDLIANERVEIFEISPTSDPLTPIFSMCRPASVKETSSLTGNKRVAQAKFDKQFKPQLEQALVRLLDRQPAEQSPIMEAVQSAAVASFQATDLPDAAPKRLVLVSDMLQHSSLGSHYSGLPDFSDYKSSPAFERSASNLSDVEVTVLYLRRPDAAAIQGLNHADFWSRWFMALDANDVTSVPIEG
ncbi:hypothetical protein [Brevundimonas sp.]|uniref:hypothetical protein n=1 Tax=Brevundimonas sp. TaxID=1871086 RepID=UPI002FC8F171